MSLSPIFQLSSDYVDQVVSRDPMAAIELGIVPDRLPDFGPEAAEQELKHMRSTLEELSRLTAESVGDERAAYVLQERLESRIAEIVAGEHLCDLNNLGSPMHTLRMAFDMVPHETPEQQSAWFVLVADLPRSLQSWLKSLETGAAEGKVASKRQVRVVVQQAREMAASKFLTDASSNDVERELAKLGEAAFDQVADWLENNYLEKASDSDGVGLERYSLAVKKWNGSSPDLLELFHWGWQELDRITVRMQEIAEQLQPGLSVKDSLEFLDNHPDYQLQGEAAILGYLRNLTDKTTEEMKAHFDIPAEIEFCEVRIAPAGSAAAPYYIPPSEDLQRPGCTYLPTLGSDTFNTWHLVSTWYHEAVPGHHLQIGSTIINREKLSRFQRTFGWTSGFGEGWALYAERLMDELGYFKDPAHEMGFLSAQALRAVRVVVDIGMHLDLEIPSGQMFEPAGERISYETSVRMLMERALQPHDFAVSETNRYLGLPAQAISYKLGEKTILECRKAAAERHGDNFDLKAWHSYVIGIGPVGLDALVAILTEY